MEAAAKAYAEIKDARATLKEKPNDPDANLVVGKYLCRTKGDWEKGLPMLALGSNAKLKALAEEDIKGATTAEEQVKLGDAWWEANGKQRASFWYEKASPSLVGLEKDRVQERLEEVATLGQEIPTVSGKPPPLAVAPFTKTAAKMYQTHWAKYLHVPVVQINSIGMKLVLIPPGEFQMGSPKELIEEELRFHADHPWYKEHLPSEAPQHRVRITKPYSLGATDVTQEEYQRLMGSNPSRFQGDSKKPVEQVSWGNAVEFCRRLSELPGEKAAKRRYGLPTEAQWEHACRGGSTGRWYFIDQPNHLSVAAEEKLLGEHAWFEANAGGQTHPVGQKRSSVWGVFDMYGNVWEWCQDWYDKDYYAKSTTDDPVGPSGGSDRVIRGGGWNPPARGCRSAFRGGFLPEGCDRLGFRVCQVLAEK